MIKSIMFSIKTIQDKKNTTSPFISLELQTLFPIPNSEINPEESFDNLQTTKNTEIKSLL